MSSTSNNNIKMLPSFVVACTAIAALALLHTSSAQTTHAVGGALGWVIPPTNNTYSTWAASNTFLLGDSLLFNFTNGVHDVAEVTKADFDACNTANPILIITTPPAIIPLNKTGQHYFLCTFTGHCNAGQKVSLDVLSSMQPPASPPITPQPPASSPAPTRPPFTFTVGDMLGWVIPPNASFYQEWTTGKTFMVGDILVFNYPNGRHDVAEVTKQAYDSCNATSPLSLFTNPPTTIALTTAGHHFYICAFTGHCPAGQKLSINVTGSSNSIPSMSPPPPVSNVPSAPSPQGNGSVPPTPGKDNSAPTMAVDGLPITFFSLLVAIILYLLEYC